MIITHRVEGISGLVHNPEKSDMNSIGSEIKLVQYYKKTKTSFLKNLDKTRKKAGEKEIHQLRVSIKKLRAGSLLIATFHHKKKKNNNHIELNKLFKSAGKIRDIQVIGNCLKAFKLQQPIKIKYLHFLKVKEKNYLNIFHKKAHRFKLRYLKEPEVEALCKHTNNMLIDKRCKTIMKKECLVINKLIAESYNSKIIHKISIHMKTITALVSLYDSLNGKTKVSKLENKLKLISVKIGGWHDHHILNNSLESFIRKRKGLTNQNFLTRMENTNKQKNRSFFKILKHKIPPVVKLIQTTYK